MEKGIIYLRSSYFSDYRFSGTELGASTLHTFVEAHGFEALLKTGKGSCFFVVEKWKGG